MQEKIINKLIKLNNLALAYNEVPVSCVIIKNDTIISSAYNMREKNKNPLDHAEIIAIRKAAKKLGTWNLHDCILYVTLKPCNMCYEVIKEARIKKIYYILNNNKKINDNISMEKINTNVNQILEQQLKNFFTDKR